LHTEVTEEGDWHSLTVYFHHSTVLRSCPDGGFERACVRAAFTYLAILDFAGPLDRNKLRQALNARGLDWASYSFAGSHPSECYVLEDRGSQWGECYPERGLEPVCRAFPPGVASRHLADLLWRLTGFPWVPQGMAFAGLQAKGQGFMCRGAGRESEVY
jgi:hypothetical protein